jgi:hypothetical protein
MKASLLYMKNEGLLCRNASTPLPRTWWRVNGLFDKYQLPYRWVNFGSAFKTKYDESVNYTELFFMLMRYHGVHVLDFPHFITTAHTGGHRVHHQRRGEDLQGTARKRLHAGAHLSDRNVNSVLNGHAQAERARDQAMEPPVPGARIGRTPKGEPAWFVPDPKRAREVPDDGTTRTEQRK